MAEEAIWDGARAREPTSRVENFLVSFVHGHPKCRFRDIVNAAEAARLASRSTVARELSALVRVGEFVVVRGSYSEADESPLPLWSRAESRWSEYGMFVYPDGSVWQEERTEFRVRAGRIRELRFVDDVSAVQQGPIWSTAPITVRWAPNPDLNVRVPEGSIFFDPPLRARDGRWEVIGFGSELRHRYRMHTEMEGSVNAAPPLPARWRDWEWEEGIIHAPTVRNRAPSDPVPMLRLTLVLPPGYPFRDAGFVVRGKYGNARPDLGEERRIRKLSRAPGDLGFRVQGSHLTLAVPEPLFDRGYLVRWKLPTRSAYRRWLERAYLGGPR
jgi:hypothetical protein